MSILDFFKRKKAAQFGGYRTQTEKEACAQAMVGVQRKKAAQFGGYRTQTEKEAWAQAMVGVQFMSEKNYRNALAISEQALAKSPRCKEAWVVKGGALTLLNRPEEALACYEQALVIDPNYEEASTQKAMLLTVMKIKSF